MVLYALYGPRVVFTSNVGVGHILHAGHVFTSGHTAQIHLQYLRSRLPQAILAPILTARTTTNEATKHMASIVKGDNFFWDRAVSSVDIFFYL